MKREAHEAYLLLKRRKECDLVAAAVADGATVEEALPAIVAEVVGVTGQVGPQNLKIAGPMHQQNGSHKYKGIHTREWNSTGGNGLLLCTVGD